MFQTFPASTLLDPPCDDAQPAYWLAQLRKADWRTVIAFARPELRVPARATRARLIQIAAPLVSWYAAASRREAQQATTTAQKAGTNVLAVVLRHCDSDWTRVADVHIGPPPMHWGLVNIGARFVCAANPAGAQ